MHSNIHRTAMLSLLLCGAFLAGCVSDQTRADDMMRSAGRARASAPMGGEALEQRKHELERTFRDLIHFNSTFDSLNRRDDREGKLMFGEFVDLQLTKQVLPMLEGEWQSRHPELSALDADVRFAVAELWMRMGSSSRTRRMLDEIERRFEGRGEMLVSYPLGEQGTLRDGLAILRSRS
jgi:hypothetical protein